MKKITIEDFFKIDLRVARIVNVKTIKEADKLIELTLDIGELGKKTVFAGIKKAYTNNELLNKLVICVNNLEERNMRFGTSEGMILASGDDEIGIFLVSSDQGALPGMQVK